MRAPASQELGKAITAQGVTAVTLESIQISQLKFTPWIFCIVSVHFFSIYEKASSLLWGRSLWIWLFAHERTQTADLRAPVMCAPRCASIQTDCSACFSWVWWGCLLGFGWVCACDCSYSQARGVQHLEFVPGSCKPPEVDAGNQSWVLCSLLLITEPSPWFSI